MKSTATFFLLFLFITIYIKAQNRSNPKSVKELESLFLPNSDSTVYSVIHNIISSNDAPTYLAIRPIINRIDRRRELSQGEGQDGFLFEGVVDQKFTIAKGRDGSSHFYKLGAIDFYFGYDLRMALDSSKPLIPSNQRIGFEFKHGIWNNVTKFDYYNIKKKKASKYNWFKRDDVLQLFYSTIQISHFSNGQSPGFYSDTINRQHDYLGGDFSTNYIKTMLFYSYFKQKSSRSDRTNKIRNLLTFGIGIQNEFGDSKSALMFSPEQKNSYGNTRLHGFFQWRSNPIYNRLLKRKKENDNYFIKNFIEIIVRWESTWITGNLDNYYHNVTGDIPKLKDDYRFSSHFYLKLDFLRARSLGLVFHHYYGRDYFNIRYDDIINTFQFGISFNFNKQPVIKFNPREAIIKTCPITE